MFPVVRSLKLELCDAVTVSEKMNKAFSAVCNAGGAEWKTLSATGACNENFN